MRDKAKKQLVNGKKITIPVRLIIVVTVSIFIVETSVMYFFTIFPPLPPYVEMITDGLLLVFFILPVLYFFIFRPIDLYTSKLTQAEKTLKESEERYRLVAENAIDAIITVDEKSTILYANSATEKIFGYTPKEILGKKLTILMPELLQHTNSASLKKYLDKGKESMSWEVIGISGSHKTGRIVPLEISFGEVIKDNKHFFTGIIRDITERRQAEEKHLQLEKQLRHSQKMEAIGILAGGIAHEFNNLLTPILGYTEMLIKKQSEDSADKKNLDQIYCAGKRGKSLVEQILAYGRKSMSERMNIQLKSIVEDALKFLKHSIPSTISIKQEFDLDLPKIFANPNEIHQVIVNLCVNACHAMPEDGTLLIGLKNEGFRKFVNLQERKLEGDFVCLYIHDTGYGINQSTLESIFDPFFTTKDVGQGTGLGLSVVQGIVEQLGGHIVVDSKIGKGTIFRIYLPVSQKKEEKPFIQAPKALPHGNENILLVDDEHTLRDLAIMMLEMIGYQVTGLTDCTKALELFKNNSHDFDLAILDYGMPKMNGKQLAEKLKEIRPDIPIILCTGYHSIAEDESIQEREWKINDILTKPYQLEEISQVVRRVLNKAEMV